ncbi:hypothetical protein C8Q80DRAFT_1101750 [Daedaleopsis nitida]|nr:hypothetical protein C8Q80DRAFT_1101750 [Daedaleopsis nitida]
MDCPKQITFYTAVYSPYAHRVQLALDEANAKYKKHQFEISRTKPEWYYQINPLGKIPSITHGGPDVPSDEPSPESAKLTESLALVEFIAETHPASGLLPTDPVLRAKARAFISFYENTVQDRFRAAFFGGQPAETILEAIESFQTALPSTGYAVGEFSIADIAVAPILVRMVLFAKNGIGACGAKETQKIREALASEKFARFSNYVQALSERPCFKKTWDEPLQVDIWSNHPVFKGIVAPKGGAA